MTKFHDDLDDQLDRLREILLSDDREKIRYIEEENRNLKEKIQNIVEIIEQQEELSKRVKPLIDKEVAHIKSNFSDTFGGEVDMEFDKKFSKSEDLILTIISPMMGKLIKKYTSIEIQKLKDKIDHQTKTTFSLKHHFNSIKGKIFKIKDSERALTELEDFKTEILDIMIIQRSGLVMGSYSKSKTQQSGDKDIYGAMLTAIRSFGEDALMKRDNKDQHLEFIDYYDYKIFLQNHHNYYFAVVLKGAIGITEKNKLADELYDFAEKENQALNQQNITGETKQYISDKLKEHFG